jgi:hypothetical protein
MSEELLQRFKGRIAEAIDGLDEESIADDVYEAVDWRELTRELLASDPDIKRRLLAKAAQLLCESVDEVEEFESLTGQDPLDFLQEVDASDGGDNSLVELCRQDPQVRQMLTATLRQLLAQELDQIETLDQLTDSGDLLSFLPPELDAKLITTELLTNDQEFRQQLEVSLRRAIKDKIRAGFELSDLPVDVASKLGLPAMVDQVLSERDFRAEIAATLQSSVKLTVMRIVRDGRFAEEIAAKVRTSQEFTWLVEKQIDILLRDQDFVARVQKSVRSQIEKDVRATTQPTIRTYLADKVRALFGSFTGS